MSSWQKSSEAGLMTQEALRRLPHPDIGLLERRTIEEAIKRAWALLKEQPHRLAVSLSVAAEVEINYAICEMLNQFLDDQDQPVAGFTASIFETVIRGGEVPDAGKTKKEKRPDLAFRLVGIRPGVSARSVDGVFTECKIVDQDHPIANYCEKGILRFVVGTYAWAMRFGIMVAYVRADMSVGRDLVPLLSETGPPYYTIRPPKLREAAADHSGIFVSAHSRKWKYPGDMGEPGEIEIVHLWLFL